MAKELYDTGELKHLADALTQLGASANATAFYLASYRTGKASVGQIARICRMDRSSGYLACQQLMDLGLIDEDMTHPRRTVLAKSPNAVLARLRTATRALRRHHDQIEESLPELLATYAERETKPVLQFYAGKDGLRQLTDDILESATGELLVLTNQRTEKNVFTDADHREFIEGRLKRDLSVRVLATDTPEARELKKRDKQSRRETRIVEGEPFTSETYIYGDKVAMLSFDKEILGFVVRSKEFATAQRWMFETIWKQLEE